MDGFNEMHESTIEIFSFFDKIPNWLRWILLIPVFLVASIVITFIIRFLYYVSPEAIDHWFVQVLANIVIVSGSIIIAVIMAPNYRVVVGIVLAVIVFIITGLVVGMDMELIFYDFEWVYLLEQLGTIIGAVVALLYVIYGVKPYEDSLEVVQERVVLADYFDDLLFDDLPLTDEEIMDDE
jgi:hypothetical protein